MSYIIEINGKHIRSYRSEERVKVGSIVPDEIWLGNKILGGRVTKVLKVF